MTALENNAEGNDCESNVFRNIAPDAFTSTPPVGGRKGILMVNWSKRLRKFN